MKTIFTTLLIIAVMITACDKKKETKETPIETAFYLLGEKYLKVSECLGEDNNEKRKTLISHISDEGNLLEYYEPCNGAIYQLAIFNDKSTEVIVLNSFPDDVFSKNAALQFFIQKGDELKLSEKEWITIEKENIEIKETYKQKFGENIPLSISLTPKNIDLIIHPNFSDSLTVVKSFKLNENRFD